MAMAKKMPLYPKALIKLMMRSLMYSTIPIIRIRDVAYYRKR
jgi:hypothetical protein